MLPAIPDPAPIPSRFFELRERVTVFDNQDHLRLVLSCSTRFVQLQPLEGQVTLWEK